MNNKGQTLGLAILSSIFIFISGLMIINFIIPEVTEFRINLNCADAEAISDGTKLLCLVGGTAVPYWILLIFSIIVGAIVSRMTL
jgi:uncharacterized membrane protein